MVSAMKLLVTVMRRLVYRDFITSCNTREISEKLIIEHYNLPQNIHTYLSNMCRDLPVLISKTCVCGYL